MSKTLTKPHANATLGHAVGAEVLKTFTLRAWRVGVVIITALTFYFAYINAELFAELAATSDGEYFTDFDGSRTLIAHAVRESILAAPYQAAALIIPVLTTFVAGAEFTNNQHVLTRLAIPSRVRLLAAKALASSVICTVVVVASFGASLVALALLLPPELRSMVMSPVAAEVLGAVLLYALVMNLVAEALTALFRSTVPALLVVVGLLVLALSGALTAIAPALGNLIPLIGAQTLLFGYQLSAMALSALQGALLLTIWAVCALAVWAFALSAKRGQ